MSAAFAPAGEGPPSRARGGQLSSRMPPHSARGRSRPTCLLAGPLPLPQFGALYWQLQQDLLAGNYTPVTSFAAERCDPPAQPLSAGQERGEL